MRRRGVSLVLSLTLGLLAAPLTTEAQQAAKVYRVGMLFSVGSPGFRPESDRYHRAFAEGLREHGYVVGQNIVVELRSARGQWDELPGLAAELVRLNVDAIVVPSSSPAQAARHATSTLPIVIVAVGDPVRTGLVASLARPGGNITGLTFFPGEGFVGKQIEFLKEVVPQASRLAILHNPANPSQPVFLKEALAAAATLRMTPLATGVRPGEPLEPVLIEVTRQRAQALFVIADPLFYPESIYPEGIGRSLVALAARHRLPAMYGLRESAEIGGLMAYAVYEPDLWRRAAGYVAKILRGAKPADLPVEQPTKFELVVNLKTAKALGLTIPQSVLIRADEVIE